MEQPGVNLQVAISEVQQPDGEWKVLLILGAGTMQFTLGLDANAAAQLALGLKEKSDLVRTKIIAPPSRRSPRMTRICTNFG